MEPVEEAVDPAVDGPERDLRRRDFNVGDFPVLDAAFPLRKTRAHQGAVFGFTERNDVGCRFEIGRGALSRQTLSAAGNQPALSKRREREWRERTDIVNAALDGEPA